ncbi:MAG: DUF7718 family protein [Nocardioidaceae bacterium]
MALVVLRMGKRWSQIAAYTPPVLGACDVHECPVELDDPNVRLHWRQAIYRGKVVDFAISVQVRGSDDRTEEWIDIYRVDTAHGVLHDHVFNRRGDTKRELEAIPAKGWDFVDAAFREHLEGLLKNWHTHVRRWNGD